MSGLRRFVLLIKNKIYATKYANGNMINNNGQIINYNYANKPIQIKTANNTINFAYDPNGQRYKKVSNNTTSHYLGKTYEKITDSRGNVDHRYYIYADGKVQAIHTNSSDGEFTTRYLHYDALNSVDTITDMNGVAIQRAIYKPFGEKIIVDEDGKQIDKKDSFTNRGYTGHESIQETENLVHMNGRVYDSSIARFISADPYIQAPLDSQSYNRYSYVKNNPLVYTDPSGYNWFSDRWKSTVNWVKDNKAAIITTIATVAVGVATGGTSLLVQGAAMGFTAGSVGTLANGGSARDALQNGFIGGTLGALSAGFAYGIGEAFGHSSSLINSFQSGGAGFGTATAKAVAHGLVRGVIHSGQGGSMKSGFLAGFVSSGFSVGTKGYGGVYSQTAIMATVGGTVSRITGGKFANGAVSGAFRFMFNETLHDAKKTLQQYKGNNIASAIDKNNLYIKQLDPNNSNSYVVTDGRLTYAPYQNKPRDLDVALALGSVVGGGATYAVGRSMYYWAIANPEYVIQGVYWGMDKLQ